MKHWVSLFLFFFISGSASCDTSILQSTLEEQKFSPDEIQRDDSKFRQSIETIISYYTAKKLTYASECRIFYKTYTTQWKHKDIVKCFEYAPLEAIPELINRLLKRQSSLAQQTLDSVIQEIAEGYLKPEYSASIKQLIDAGASTKEISLQHITIGNDIACKATILILKANKRLYQDKRSLYTPVDGSFRAEDLHYLSNTDVDRGLCPEVIQLLISFNPELRNIQNKQYGETPFHLYLIEPGDVNIAKALMTKKNINMQTKKGGVTALHSFLYSHWKSPFDLEIIKAALKLGADIDIKDDNGVSIRDLIKKRPDLVSVLK